MPEHAGFDDWIEVFSAGRHTDSSNQARTWTRAELDEIVANHNAEAPAPLVIGHPKTDAPAWGWTGALKRQGTKLLAKFNQVPQAVATAVRDGRYRNRSVKVARGEKGWQLIHVGLLGAAPPAVEGLAPIAFSEEPTGPVYEFDALHGASLSLIAKGMQRLREMIIAQFGMDDADRFAPQSEIDDLNALADAERTRDIEPDEPAPSFARPNTETHDMSDSEKVSELKRELEHEREQYQAAQTRIAEFDAAKRLREARAIVESAQSEGRLTPAQSEGLAEFIASEPLEGEFEFTASEGGESVKRSRHQFLRDFLAALPKQIEFGRRTEAAESAGDDPAEIVQAAREFQTAEQAKGHDVPWHEAVIHVRAAR
jgi:phage I-like protein